MSTRLIDAIDGYSIYTSKSAHAIEDAVNFIRKYEDAAEQGRMVILPCKVGDTVYRIHTHDHIEETAVIAIHVSVSGVWYWDETGRETPIEKIGKTVFTSRAEAEAALKGESKEEGE